ncbi:MAG: hypothetical protein QG673_301 [Pseudomonadota bacterium]|nr:hypothetical protein [Pseudomonadota bacterium]
MFNAKTSDWSSKSKDFIMKVNYEEVLKLTHMKISKQEILVISMS